jgi:ferrochelatase
VAYTIATLRRKKSEGYLRKDWRRISHTPSDEEQARSLQAELMKARHGCPDFRRMCAAPPFLEEAIDNAVRSGVRQLVILPLFPQFSTTTTGSGFPVLQRLIAARPQFKSIEVRWVREWYDHPVYIEAFTLAIQRELDKSSRPLGKCTSCSVRTASRSYVRQGDPYLVQTEKTVQLIMESLRQKGYSNGHQLAFQAKWGLRSGCLR